MNLKMKINKQISITSIQDLTEEEGKIIEGLTKTKLVLDGEDKF